ncbi:MAG: AAA family ATPase [Actinomycetota bacterium]
MAASGKQQRTPVPKSGAGDSPTTDPLQAELDAAVEEEAAANAAAWNQITAEAYGDTASRMDWVEDSLARYAAKNSGYRRSSWFPENLEDALDGRTLPEAEHLVRVDGRALVYAGKAHTFFGANGSMKTVAALMTVAEFLRRGEAVFYMDFEDDRFTIVSWLVNDHHVPPDAVRQHLLYVRPEEPFFGQGARSGRIDVSAVGQAFRPTLWVIDGMTEAMALHGMDVNSATDVARFQRELLRFKIRGLTRIVLDHEAKAGGKDGGRPTQLGSQHKTSGIDGAAYRFDLQVGAGPGGTSRSTITVEKDRPAMVLPQCAPPQRYGIAAELRWGPDGPQLLSPHAIAEEKAAAKAADTQAQLDHDVVKVRGLIRNEVAQTSGPIRKLAGISSDRVKAATAILREQGDRGEVGGIVRENNRWVVIAT